MMIDRDRNEAERLMRNVDAIRYGTMPQAIGFYLSDLRAERKKMAEEIEGRLTFDGRPLAGVEDWIIEIVREAAP